MPKIAVYTLGCKVSQYESEAVLEEFVKRGFTAVEFDTPADVYVINTCTVTAESDRKSRQFIRRAIGKNPDAVVAVMGCYTQRAPMDVAAIDGVDIVVGTADKMSVVDKAIAILEGRLVGQQVSAPRLTARGLRKCA